MPDRPSTSPQIIESIEVANEQVVGLARSQALAVAYQNLAHSLSLSMQNAVAAQQAAATVRAAVVSATIERLLSDPTSEERSNA